MTIEGDALKPDWSAPDRVRALSTTRAGGVSGRPWDSLNLGSHVEDNPDNVQQNRLRLAESADLTSERIGWLNQVHGTDVVELTPDNVGQIAKADASYTRHPGIACAILTADCLPVVLSDSEGTVVGAAHCGWRSLCGGVIENLVNVMAVAPETLQAWLGPAIGPDSFEVGPEVRDAFLEYDPKAARAFKAKGARAGHFMADIYVLATLRLNHLGVSSVTGGGLCTVQDSDRFFSYRRDGQTGRMATLVWLVD
ncbi:multi-copper polyphenol oxidoreductase [Marinobacter adhaerens]|uniref:peptidoglycan editing factor PgeF n=1 Tax=Marinobacter adhaerens TaxID=1033846 RepID=UPI000840CC34|nr:peptidoglycan editing factor PgeF [Marinobacter adhaerens]ODM28363.1 multi-copper polyphenol oxidoreductase [Marinobacter adhaerens]